MPIHPTAQIDSTAKIAEDVHIGPFAVVGPDVAIGAAVDDVDPSMTGMPEHQHRSAGHVEIGRASCRERV